MKPRLHTLIASTRPGRQGPAVARWFHGIVAEHGGFDASLVDLADFKLPVFDEPNHPSSQQYQHAHTRAWSDSVATADAFVFVTPEYNAGPPPALLNALDYLFREWHCKPVAFVSYGGVSGGLRAVQMLKQIVTTLKMMPMAEAVVLPNFQRHLDAEGRFAPEAPDSKAASDTLAELLRWSRAMSALR
jgi:NAD(P)H-dependent FMN reductase